MGSRILNSIANAIDNRDECKNRKRTGEQLFKDLKASIQKCLGRYGGKSELATEDDIRIKDLCSKWESVLCHGIKITISGSIQSIVAAGLNFSFNVDNVGPSLWSYTSYHLSKHEKERFKLLTKVNTPLGNFRAFIRAALNERSLERYLHSWLSHGLLPEYYEEGSLVRESEAEKLPSLASGLSTILFALSIDKDELNESQLPAEAYRNELVIPLPAPVKAAPNMKKRPVRQIISFDKSDNANENAAPGSQPSEKPSSSWNSAPSTCLNSPDPRLPSSFNGLSPNSEPSTSDHTKNTRQFFPEKSSDSPSQLLSRLTEKAKEIFSSPLSNDAQAKTDGSERWGGNLKGSESDSEEIAESIDGSVSCLELCFTEDDNGPEDLSQSIVAKQEKALLELQLKYSQMDILQKEKVKKLENVILDLGKENDRLKEQLKKYMSALEIGKALKKDDNHNSEVTQYEAKLVQVAEMHAELMEFNQHLQRRLQELESASTIELVEEPTSNVKVHIPAAFLVSEKTGSFHVYQIFVKVGLEEWNVYHRYAKFRELHLQLRKCNQDIDSYKFPPKKIIGKKHAGVVELRRAALLSYLRHIVLVLPEVRSVTTRAQLITLLPFFGTSSSNSSRGTGSLTRFSTSGSSSSFTNSYPDS